MSAAAFVVPGPLFTMLKTVLAARWKENLVGPASYLNAKAFYVEQGGQLVAFRGLWSSFGSGGPARGAGYLGRYLLVSWVRNSRIWMSQLEITRRPQVNLTKTKGHISGASRLS